MLLYLLISLSPRKTKNNIFSDFYAPLSLNAEKHGKLIEDKGDIKTRLHGDGFILEREFKPLNNHEAYSVNVLDKNNKELITKFTDERFKHSEFMRRINGYNFH